MSQSVPLSKLMPQYNAMVESFQRRMQQDNVHHLTNMLNAYGYALHGGACSASLSHMERKLANRDNYNTYRTQKDASEWMKVDKKIHSYLGSDMMALAGGQHGEVPISKEPQMVQTLRLLSAFIANLTEKMMSARRASLEELQEAVNILLQDTEARNEIKAALYTLTQLAASSYKERLERDASDLMQLEYDTLMALAPSTAECILKCGVSKRLRHGQVREVESVVTQLPARPRLLDEVAARMAPMAPAPSVRHTSPSPVAPRSPQPTLQGGENKKPVFRSRQAAELYNIISG